MVDCIVDELWGDVCIDVVVGVLPVGLAVEVFIDVPVVLVVELTVGLLVVVSDVDPFVVVVRGGVVVE